MEKLDIATRNILGTSELKNSVSFREVNGLKITKVLTSSMRANIDNIMVGSGEVKFDGVLEYDLLVVLENGEITPLTTKENFSLTFENSEIEQGSVIDIQPTITELISSNFSPDEFVYNSSVSFEICAVNVSSDLSCAVVPENVFVKEGEVTFNALVANETYEGVVTFDIAKDSKVNKILFVRNNASIKSSLPSNDYFVVNGDIYTTIVFLTEDGTIKSIVKENSFSEEIEAKGVTKDSNIQAAIDVRETVVNESEDGSKFNFEVPIVINANVFDTKTLTCVEDAYSTKYELTLTTVSYEQDSFMPTKLAEENILTNFALSEGLNTIDKILAVIPTNIRVVSQIVKDKEVLIDGIASINVIYYSEDDEGNNVLNSVDIDIPYSLSFNAPDVKSGDNVKVGISFGDLNVKSRHGRELEILAEVKINYNVSSREVSYITTEITLGEEKESQDYALEIYVAHANQTLWDIAKELNIGVADIMAQNKDLALPLQEGEKIVVYRQVNN